MACTLGKDSLVHSDDMAHIICPVRAILFAFCVPTVTLLRFFNLQNGFSLASAFPSEPSFFASSFFFLPRFLGAGGLLLAAAGEVGGALFPLEPVSTSMLSVEVAGAEANTTFYCCGCCLAGGAFASPMGISAM